MFVSQVSSLFSNIQGITQAFSGALRRTMCGTVTHRPGIVAALCLALAFPHFLAAQEADFAVYSDSPRLFLNQRRLRLLKRERERESMRWMQFDALMAGKAAMPEPGFAGALYGVVAGRTDSCIEAGKWAAGADANDAAQARQMALVYDWCLDAIGEAQSMTIARKLSALLRPAPGDSSVARRSGDESSTGNRREREREMTGVRSATLAAIALADVESKPAQAYLRWAVESWWRGRIVPRLKNGEQPFRTRAELFAMTEFLHVIRDNLRIDLREGVEKWFEELPPLLLLSYYPQPWPTPENEYRIPAYDAANEPDLREAALARTAEMALVAYDANAQVHQFLQGWLMMDRFLMRGAFGAPYEFLWANPYQPGLSFTYMPDLFHSNGRLLVRSGWDEDASWFSYDNGKAQAFQHGKRIAVRTGANLAPLKMGAVMIFFPPQGLKFEAGWLPPPAPDERQRIEEIAFILGLDANSCYDVEVDGEEMYEARTDRGGILELKFAPGRKAGVRIKKFSPQVQ